MGKKLVYLLKGNPFIRGAVRIIDFGCTVNKDYILNELNKYSDSEKLSHDWENVGKDLNTALNKYRENQSCVEA